MQNAFSPSLRVLRILTVPAFPKSSSPERLRVKILAVSPCTVKKYTIMYFQYAMVGKYSHSKKGGMGSQNGGMGTKQDQNPARQMLNPKLHV
jgi:hypothetical protein